MIKLNRILMTVLCVVLAAALCGCGCGGNRNPGEGMELDAIMEEILADANLEFATSSIPLDNDNFAYYAFIEPIDGAEGLASEALIGSIAHSVVLIRLPANEDASSVAESIRANADPRKWLCVEAEATEVVTHGNLVLLVMSFEDQTASIVDAFDRFCAD